MNKQKTNDKRDRNGKFMKGNVPPKWNGGRNIHKGYVQVINHQSGMSDIRGRVKEHRLVMADYLGRDLEKDEVVHHINKNKTDNRIENLLLFKNHSDHRKYELSSKRVAVLGAGGLIGSHLVSYLKEKGFWVRGVDIRLPKFSSSNADEFLLLDLREYRNCLVATKGIDEVYQLAADMGGMLFISTRHIESLHNSNLINTFVPKASVENKVKRLFFSSSACVYPTIKQQDLNGTILTEEDAYPAQPNEAYGWEKILAEQRYLAYADKYPIEVRIARFENCYGTESVYEGGREKAPAALCRKVALAEDGTSIDVWGDGKAMRSYMHVQDCIEGIYALMQSDYKEPINLGSAEVVSVDTLANIIIEISGKDLKINHVEGPQGVRARYLSHEKARKNLNWVTQVNLREGMEELYEWVGQQL